MSTTTRPGFTKNTGTAARTVSCCGINHSDVGDLGTCDGCGLEVVRREDRKVYTVRRVGMWSAARYYCWEPKGHQCNPEMVEARAAAVARSLAAGEIIKGQTVTVVKGRKIPKDTTGTVNFVGDGDYGPRVGFRTEAGEQHFTALANVGAIPAALDAAARPVRK